ncbi:MAG: lytic murein transglycosylase [Methylophaga sp.]|nr:lytic murein transglycosylase [Methylophaga sp.]
MPDGNIKVLNIHLGTTTYQQAQYALRELGEVAIFVNQEGKASLEVFFDAINLAGLSARAVLNLKMNDDELRGLIDRSPDAGRLQRSGARRYQIHHSDYDAVFNAPVMAMTYIPGLRLDEAMLRYRFGEPIAIEHQAEDGAELWRYPHLGLTVGLHPSERPVLLFEAN